VRGRTNSQSDGPETNKAILENLSRTTGWSNKIRRLMFVLRRLSSWKTRRFVAVDEEVDKKQWALATQRCVEELRRVMGNLSQRRPPCAGRKAVPRAGSSATWRPRNLIVDAAAKDDAVEIVIGTGGSGKTDFVKKRALFADLVSLMSARNHTNRLLNSPFRLRGHGN